MCSLLSVQSHDGQDKPILLTQWYNHITRDQPHCVPNGACTQPLLWLWNYWLSGMLSCTVNCSGTRLQSNRAGEMARNPCPRGKEAPSHAFPLYWQRPPLGLVTWDWGCYFHQGQRQELPSLAPISALHHKSCSPHSSHELRPMGRAITAPRSQMTSPAVFELLKGTAGTQYSPSAPFKSLLLCQSPNLPKHIPVILINSFGLCFFLDESHKNWLHNSHNITMIFAISEQQ